MSSRVDGKIVNDLSPDAVIKSIAHRPGSGRLERLHLDEAAGGARDGAGDGRHHAADPAARRRPGRRPRRDVRRLAGRPGAAVGARAWWSGAPCSTRPTTTWRRRSTPPSPWCDEEQSLMSELYLPAGAAADGPYDLVVTPESAGWGYSSLRIAGPAAGAEHRLRHRRRGDHRGAAVRRGRRSTVGRSDLRRWPGGPTCSPGRPTSSTCRPVQPPTLTSHRRRPVRPVRRAHRTPTCRPTTQPWPRCPVELRGAGQCQPPGAQLRHPGRRWPPASIIACEVITPGGNWSSYPAHKHDEATEPSPSWRRSTTSRSPPDRTASRASASCARPPRPATTSTSAKRSTTATRCWCRTAGTGPASRRPATTCTT